MLSLQFDTLMTAYKKHSRQWSAVYNKFAEGTYDRPCMLHKALFCCALVFPLSAVRMRGRKRAMVG